MMLGCFKEMWRQFKSGPPGKRFQDLLKWRRQFRESRLKRILVLGSGALFLAAGIFFMIAPGPGAPIFFIGAILLSQESEIIARFFDWVELRLRHLIGSLGGRKNRGED